MCDKILLVVRHNDQTDQIFKTIIAPFLAAFLHTHFNADKDYFIFTFMEALADVLYFT